jgi:hypothetical protein
MPSLTRVERRERESERTAGSNRILRVLASLLSAQADLDTVDGEFLFRCCVLGCDDHLQRLRARSYADGLDKLNAAEGLWIDFRIPLVVATAHVFDGAPLRLRHPELTVSVGAKDERPVEQSISAKVFAYDLTGERVARLVSEGYQQRYPVRQEASGTAHVRIDFSLVGGVEEPNGMEPPHVKVTMPLPLLPQAVIAVAYDSIVRDQHAWHEHIAQATRQQEVVAMRTWTVALLRKQGMTTDIALACWQRETGMPAPYPQIFQDDLNRLLARVPEATPHLSMRNRRLPT